MHRVVKSTYVLLISSLSLHKYFIRWSVISGRLVVNCRNTQSVTLLRRENRRFDSGKQRITPNASSKMDLLETIARQRFYSM